MATIHNSELIQALIDKAKIQTSQDISPTQLAEKIIPTLAVEPEKRVYNSGTTKSSTGAMVLFTTPADRKFFLTGIQLSYVKDATCDLGTGEMAFLAYNKLFNISDELLCFTTITLTAQQDSLFMSFNPPLELQPSTTITNTSNFAAGILIRSGLITGYTLNKD